MTPRLAYPDTTRDDVIDVVHGREIADPYRWLEDAASEHVQSWMHSQDELTRGYLEKLPARERLRARVAELSYRESISAPTKRGKLYFYTRQHVDKEKAVLYAGAGDREGEVTLIDPNALSDDGSIALGGYWPSPDGTKLAYKLKKNNADAATMYVMDVSSRAISEVDVIEGAKYAFASWTPDSKGFYYTRLPTDPTIPVADLPGHAHVRHHRLGQPPENDTLVYPATGNPRTFVHGTISRDGRFLIVSVAQGWSAMDVYIKDLKAPARKKQRLAADAPAWQQHGFTPLVTGVRAAFSVKAWRGSLYVLTNHEAPRFRVFKVDPARMDMASWREIVPESEDGEGVLDSMTIVGNHLVLGYLRNAHGHIEVRTLDGRPVRTVPLPALGSVLAMSGSEDDDELFYVHASFTQPEQVYRTSVTRDQSTLWGKVELPIDMSRYVVEQVWYPSKDGTRISMFIVRRNDAQPDGRNPTLLYGYGGFTVNMTPSFAAKIAVWLELGGIYALPNLRGGGEYGEAWHEAGMLLNKQNVFDDYIHAARFLIQAGWTSPERLAIQGRSNGGLLVGAAMTQEPGLFKAVVCGVPLLDMVRYHLFGSGKTWIPEYGSAEDPAQFAALYAYSPYHRVSKGTKYPSLLMMSVDSDDRVDPVHARKFVAAVQWAQASAAPALLRIERNAGHSGADLVRQRVDEDTDMLAFIASELGVTVPGGD